MSVGRSPRIPHLHSKGAVKLRGAQAESAIIAHRDGREGLVRALKFDGHVNAEDIYNMVMQAYASESADTEDILNMVMTKFDSYTEADATMFAGKKYDGYCASSLEMYAFVGTKYDGYVESSVVI